MKILLVEENRNCGSAMEAYLKAQYSDAEIMIADSFTNASVAVQGTQYDQIWAKEWMGFGLRARHFNPNADVTLYYFNGCDLAPADVEKVRERIVPKRYVPPSGSLSAWNKLLKFPNLPLK